MRIKLSRGHFRNIQRSTLACSRQSIAQLSERELQFLYRKEVKENHCVYTFGQGTKLEIKRKYLFEVILHCFCLIGLLFVPFCVFLLVGCQGCNKFHLQIRYRGEEFVPQESSRWLIFNVSKSK
jgi:hypothetical protein